MIQRSFPSFKARIDALKPLVAEYRHVEGSYLGTQTNGLPAPWVEALLEEFGTAMPPNAFRRLPLEKCPPMTARLRRLARKRGLPSYEGTAPRRILEESQPPLERPVLKVRKTRCTICGSWAYPSAWLDWRDAARGNVATLMQPVDLAALQESPLRCPDCGATESPT